MSNKNRIKEIFEDLGVLNYGHFLFTSGRHGSTYMQCARLLEEPRYTEEVVKYILEEFQDEDIDIVVGPAIGGISLSYEYGRQLNVKSIFAEREDGEMILRRGFTIPEGARVLIVEDVITTGGSVIEVVDLVENQGGDIVGIAVLVDRTAGEIDFGYRLVAGYSKKLGSYSPEECPICKEGNLTLEKPGSKKFSKAE